MVAKAHPGCAGTAAKLPNSPGTQKLTPPSSANSAVGVTSASASTLSNDRGRVVMMLIAPPVLGTLARTRGIRCHRCWRDVIYTSVGGELYLGVSSGGFE